MFELLNPTKTKIVDVVVLSQKNRQPDDNPGAKISVEQQLHNSVLSCFDGFLLGFLYTEKPGATASPQQGLDGVPQVSDKPHLTAIGSRAGWIHWDQEHTGYGVVVDYGTGGKSDLALADCKLSGWRFKANEGGTIDVRYNIESNDVSEKAFGRLAKMKSTEVDVTVRPPEVGQQDLDDAPEPKLTPAQLRQANAAGKTPEQALAEAVADGKATPETKPEPAWPFPPGDPRASGAAVNPSLAGVKYRDPDSGQTWSGRGRKPRWLEQALADGKPLAKFAVDQVAA